MEENRMKWFKNFKIETKLIIGFLLVAVIALIVGIVGLTSMYKINDGSDLLFRHDTLGLAYAGDSSTNFQRLSIML